MGKIIDIAEYRTQGVQGMKTVTINAYEDFVTKPDGVVPYGKGEVSVVSNDTGATFEWDESKDEDDTHASPYLNPYDFLTEVLEALGYDVNIKVEYETDES